MSSTKKWGYESLGMLALEETVRHLAPDSLLYIYTLIALIITWEGFYRLSKNSKWFEKSFRKVTTYIIVVFIGVGLASGYWWGIKKILPNRKATNAEIIEQLDQFVRDGKVIKLKIESMLSSEFPSKYDLPRIKKDLPIETEFKEWSNDVYIYLHFNVLAWAEDYKRLPTQVTVKNLKRNMTRQGAYRVSMKAMADSHIEQILEIIKSVNSSSN